MGRANSTSLSLPVEQWDVISEHLHAISSSTAITGLRSTVITDRVCIDLGQGACAQIKANARPPIIKKEWWKLWLAAILAGAATIAVTSAYMCFQKHAKGNNDGEDNYAAIPSDSRAEEETKVSSPESATLLPSSSLLATKA